MSGTARGTKMYNECVKLAKTYFSKIHQISQTDYASDEQSYYCALGDLIEGIIRVLEFDAACVCQPQLDSGKKPDFVLCSKTQNQINRKKHLFGIIEVIGISKNISRPDKQVRKYLKECNYVILTNYREFVLFCGEKYNQCAYYQISMDIREFWIELKDCNRLAEKHARDLTDFIKSSMEKMNIEKEVSKSNIDDGKPGSMGDMLNKLGSICKD